MDTIRETTPRIVVGVDGSAESKNALVWAGRIARGYNAQVEAVIAWQHPYAYGWTVVPAEWDPAGDAERALVTAVDEVFGTERSDRIQLTVREGYPANVLVTASRDAIMLVVGSRGRGGFAGLLLGSVSSNVAAHAKCPVLIVHRDETSPAGTAA